MIPGLIMLLVYIAVSSVVGFAGRNRKFSFWGYFFASLALTPFIGLLLVLGSDERRDYRRD
jgi:hypothetical protein